MALAAPWDIPSRTNRSKPAASTTVEVGAPAFERQLLRVSVGKTASTLS